MPRMISTLRPTTELQAINVILGSIGEAPLPSDADLSTLATNDANVESAVSLLTEATREVLVAGWRFNTLTGFEVAPAGTVEWEDSQGEITTLNVFTKAADVLAWAQTKCSQMVGVDLVERPSLQYEVAGSPVLVLFDRVRNRDGLDASQYDSVYLDIVTAVDFEDMPEAARRLATVVASRRMCQRLAASDLQASFTAQDEMAALRTLKREQGLTEHLNLFHTADAFDITGRRQPSGGGYSARVYRGGA